MDDAKPPYLLSGLKVVDAATVIAAPAAAMILADFGADVVKVEQPGSGDMLRMISSVRTMPGAGINYLWHMDARNKRSITLNLRTEAGLAVLHRLAAECDVFITNHPYPVRERLRLTYDDLRSTNPTMIYASLTAYGERGPERNRKAFDQLAYWARSGLMDLMREEGTVPAQGLPGMGDHPTALAIYGGIVTALLHRERTGEGSMVETSLLANGLWSASAVAQGVLAGGDMSGFREWRRNPQFLFLPYRCSDGRWLQFNMVRTEELLYLLLTGMDAMHLLSDERFASWQAANENRTELKELIQDIIGQRPSEAWLETFEALDVPVNRVAVVEELVTDPQVLENRMAIPVTDPAFEMPLVVTHPIRVSGVPHVEPEPGPELGEHSEEILRELGYDEDAIAAMRDEGAL